MISLLEKTAIQYIKDKFRIQTVISESDSKLTLTVHSVYGVEIIYSHHQDLEPIISAVLKRTQQ